jgi:hypothetical protein
MGWMGRRPYFVLDCLVAPNGGHVLRHFGGCEGGGVACGGSSKLGNDWKVRSMEQHVTFLCQGASLECFDVQLEHQS